MAQWKIDPDHSVAAFSVRHMTVAFVHGQMNDVSGTVRYDHGNSADMEIAFEIGVQSIITGISKRDDHLKSADFFDVARYPKISFTSRTIRSTGPDTYAVSGDLTIHGISKSVTLEIDFSGPIKSPFGETCIGFTGKTVLDRDDFQITWNQALEGGGLMVGKEVEISVDIEADLID